MAIGGDVHVTEQPHARGDTGEKPERRDGVVPRRAHRVGSRARDGDVVAHRDVVEPGLVARPRDRRELRGARALLPLLDKDRALRLDGQLHAVANGHAMNRSANTLIWSHIASMSVTRVLNTSRTAPAFSMTARRSSSS